MLETANQGNLSQSTAKPGASALVQSNITTVDDLIERIITWTHALVGEAEIVRAREIYYADNGKSFYDDAFYEARLSYFFDQFVFERPAPLGSESEQRGTPYELFLDAMVSSGRLEADELALYRSLSDFRHSVFQIHKIQDDQMVLSDLVAGDKVTVKAKSGERFRAGLEKKNILQGFVYRFGESRHLSNGLMMHPQRADRILKRYLKTAQKQPEFAVSRALAKLASLQIRHLRHKHVDAKVIYQTGLK